VEQGSRSLGVQSLASLREEACVTQEEAERDTGEAAELLPQVPMEHRFLLTYRGDKD
jgi:hypothetical protein